MGPADEIDGDEKEIWSFLYTDPCDPFQLNGIHPIVPSRNEETGQWGLELILYYENFRGDTYGEKAYSNTEIDQKVMELAQLSGQNSEIIKMFQYSWETNEKEPVVFP